MNELALFAGAGGGILGGKLLGWTTVCAVEWEPYPASILIARQNDGVLPPFPIWDDVRTFDGTAWRGRVDVVSGGFPCQDISAAGKGAGIDGERSGMWAHMARIIREVEPRYVFVENSPMLTSRGLGRVLGDLAAMGFDAEWGVLGADDAGAPHKRERIWIVGYTHSGSTGRQRRGSTNNESERASASARLGEDMADAAQLLGNGGDDHAGISPRRESLPESGNCGGASDMADADKVGRMRWTGSLSQSGGRGQLADGSDILSDADRAGLGEQRRPVADGAEHAAAERGGWWGAEPDVGRVANGVAARVDRLKAIGNGQVPAVAALAWRILSK